MSTRSLISQTPRRLETHRTPPGAVVSQYYELCYIIVNSTFSSYITYYCRFKSTDAENNDIIFYSVFYFLLIFFKHKI